jgi:hypothetical protein
MRHQLNAANSAVLSNWHLQEFCSNQSFLLSPDQQHSQCHENISVVLVSEADVPS